MKKIVSVLLALLMLSLTVSAFAEADISDWVEVQMNDVGMHFYRPADLNVSENPEADGGDSCYYLAGNDMMNIAVYCVGTNEQSLADITTALTEQGFTVEMNALAEAGLTYDHLTLTMADIPNYAAVVFQGTDGYFYDFECEELSDGGMYTFGVMLGTLSPM